jgi:hypothetical protein
MWSDSLLNEFSTFKAQYAIEILHSLGSIFDRSYLTNENLRQVMINLAKRDEKCFYQLALHAYEQLQINDSFDLSTVFNEEEFDTVKNFIDEDLKNPVSNTQRHYKFLTFVFHLGKK